MKHFIRSQPLLAWILVGTLSVVGAAFVLLVGPQGVGLALGLLVAIGLGLAILRTPILGLWLILFFLPFERIPSLDIAGITVRINFLLGLVTMVSAGLAWLSTRRRLPANPIWLPVLLILTVSVASLIEAEAMRRGLLTIAFILFTFGFQVLVVGLLERPEQLKRALSILWCSAAVVGLFGIYQFLGDLAGLPNGLTGLREIYTKAIFGFPRVQAFSIEPLYLGNYLLLPLSLLVAALLLRVKNLTRAWHWGLLGLLLLIFVLTLSRGAYLAGLVSFGLIILTLPRESFQPRWLLGGLLIGTIAVAGALLFVSQGEGDALARFGAHARIADFGTGESTQGRLSTVNQALDFWRESPLLGIGIGNFGPKALGYPETADDYPIVNNEYVELLAETGPTGLVAFVLLALLLLHRSLLAYREIRSQPGRSHGPLLEAALIGTTAAFLGTLVQYNFFSTLYIIHVWVLVGLLVAVQNLILTNAKGQSSNVK